VNQNNGVEENIFGTEKLLWHILISFQS